MTLVKDTCSVERAAFRSISFDSFLTHLFLLPLSLPALMAIRESWHMTAETVTASVVALKLWQCPRRRPFSLCLVWRRRGGGLRACPPRWMIARTDNGAVTPARPLPRSMSDFLSHITSLKKNHLQYLSTLLDHVFPSGTIQKGRQH